MSLGSIFRRRVRGFRLVEVVATGLLSLMMIGVYFAKTSAGGERSRIDVVERQIAEEKARIRMLDAEVAYLERPRRVGRLASDFLQLQPLKADRETSVEALGAVALIRTAPRPAAPVAPVATPASTPAPTPEAETPPT